MAHYEGYTRTQVGHICQHDARQQGDGCNHSNESIDDSRTHLNYNLASDLQPMKATDFIQQRTSEVRCLKRDDVNVMGSCVLTLPKDFTGNERAFFESAYRFFVNQHGAENVISAWVHMDENQPHLHFKFVPITTDKKRGDLKVCLKEITTKSYLKRFHGELQKHLESELACPCNILNGATAGGNKTVQELKAQSLADKNAKAEEKLSATQQKALEYEQPPKKALERQQSYEDRVATGQQAVAVRQRTAELDAREADLQRRQSDFDAEVTRKATEIAKSTMTRREHDEIRRRKQAEAERDNAIRSRDEAVRQATEPLRKANRNLRELLEDTVEQYTGQLITADELLERKQRAEEQKQNQNRNLYRKGR